MSDTTTSRIVEPLGQVPLYPLRFEPIYQYRLWGGRRLAGVLTVPLPGDGRREMTALQLSPGTLVS